MEEGEKTRHGNQENFSLSAGILGSWTIKHRLTVGIPQECTVVLYFPYSITSALKKQRGLL